MFYVLCVLHYSMYIAYSHLPEYALQYLSRILCVTFYLCRCLSCHNAKKNETNRMKTRRFVATFSLTFTALPWANAVPGLNINIDFSVSLRIFRFNSHGVLRRLIVRKIEIEICTI